MTNSSYLWLLLLAITFGILAGMLKAFLSRLRLKRKAQAPLLGVVLPKNQNSLNQSNPRINLKHKDEL